MGGWLAVCLGVTWVVRHVGRAKPQISLPEWTAIAVPGLLPRSMPACPLYHLTHIHTFPYWAPSASATMPQRSRLQKHTPLCEYVHRVAVCLCISLSSWGKCACQKAKLFRRWHCALLVIVCHVPYTLDTEGERNGECCWCQCVPRHLPGACFHVFVSMSAQDSRSLTQVTGPAGQAPLLARSLARLGITCPCQPNHWRIKTLQQSACPYVHINSNI